MRAERASGEWLHLDAGFYQGMNEVADHYEYPVSAPGRQGAPVPFTLCGPTCDSTDVISKTQKLPDDIDEEDLVVFQNSTAYSEAVSTHFNGMNPPAIHFLDELVSG